MSKVVIATTVFTFWVLYEMSGGADFTPRERKAVTAKAPVNLDKPEVTTDLVVAAVLEQDSLPQKITAEPAVALETDTGTAAEVMTVGYRVEPASDRVRELLLQNVTPAAAETPADADDTNSGLDIRTVAGSRVNMRDGPSTNYLVLDTLSKGAEAEVLAVNADGWAQVRVMATGQIGWMALRLLSDS